MHALRSKLYTAKNLTEIHGALSEICFEITVGRRKVSHWANRFRSGCVSIDNDPRLWRPRISTDESNVKLVADALEEACRATREELSRAAGAKLLQENAQEPTSVVRGWATHSPWQCSPAHRECCKQKNFAIIDGKSYLMRPTVQT